MNEMRREFNIPETAECRVWSKYTSCYKLIEDLSSTYQVQPGMYIWFKMAPLSRPIFLGFFLSLKWEF